MERKNFIGKREEKIALLYELYRRLGFDLTTDQIVENLKIERKTFYNRYGNYENSLKLTIDYAHQQFILKFDEGKIHCNHAIEELVLFVSLFRDFAITDNVFFQYDQKHALFVTDHTPFRSLLENIIYNCRRAFYIRKDVDLEIYIPYFFYNLCNAATKHHLSTEMQYLLMPLLNERGMDLTHEICFDHLM